MFGLCSKTAVLTSLTRIGACNSSSELDASSHEAVMNCIVHSKPHKAGYVVPVDLMQVFLSWSQLYRFLIGA